MSAVAGCFHAVMAALLLSSCATEDVGGMSAAAMPSGCSEKPVLMVIAGETLDRDRMAVYNRALDASRLYDRTGGVYLNRPKPLRVFEGEVEDNYATLVVRFPSECAAVAFWRSDTYQTRVKPLRENPSAGDYTVLLYEAL